jgi:predicted amidohydrolase YtcJ
LPLGLAHSLGIPLILNSDYPAGPLGPVDAIHAAVTRDAGAGRTIGSDQAIPRAVAWSAFTTGPARCSGDSALGSLEPGRRADLVVFEEDPLAERTDLRSLSVTATMLDGRFVHGAVELAA